MKSLVYVGMSMYLYLFFVSVCTCVCSGVCVYKVGINSLPMIHSANFITLLTEAAGCSKHPFSESN